jgi:hypothetical protein
MAVVPTTRGIFLQATTVPILPQERILFAFYCFILQLQKSLEPLERGPGHVNLGKNIFLLRRAAEEGCPRKPDPAAWTCPP